MERRTARTKTRACWSFFHAYAAAMVLHAGPPAPVRLRMALAHAWNEYGVFANIVLGADDDYGM